MTKRFILDENVVILAQKGENEHGEVDETCMALIQQIIAICHTIVLDWNLWETYTKQLAKPGHAHPTAGLRVLLALKSAAYMAGKLDIRKGTTPEFPEETSIPQSSQDDLHVIRLLVDKKAPLVTTDRPLIEDLESSGIQEKYALSVLTPEEALEQL